MAYTVVGSAVSPFVRKTLVFLHEKGIDHEVENLNPYAPPEGFREISPLGKIPVLKHDDRVIHDSSIICRYLERLHPEPAFYPDAPETAAHAEWLEEYVDGGLQPVGSRVFQPLVLQPLLTGKEVDETEPRRVADEELPPFYDYLDAQLGDREWYVEDRIGIADLSVASIFVNLRLAGYAPDATRWPRLRGFLQRMHARDSFTAVIDPVVALMGKRWVEID